MVHKVKMLAMNTWETEFRSLGPTQKLVLIASEAVRNNASAAQATHYMVCWYCSPGDRLRYTPSCLVHWENFKTQNLLPISDTEISLKNLQVTFLLCKHNDLSLHSWLYPTPRLSCGTCLLTQCCEGRHAALWSDSPAYSEGSRPVKILS